MTPEERARALPTSTLIGALIDLRTNPDIPRFGTDGAWRRYYEAVCAEIDRRIPIPEGA